jgi:hypothetical protein
LYLVHTVTNGADVSRPVDIDKDLRELASDIFLQPQHRCHVEGVHDLKPHLARQRKAPVCNGNFGSGLVDANHQAAMLPDD